MYVSHNQVAKLPSPTKTKGEKCGSISEIPDGCSLMRMGMPGNTETKLKVQFPPCPKPGCYWKVG